MKNEQPGFVSSEYLTELARTVAPLKRRIHQLLGVDAASRVLDAGCGPGTDTLLLAKSTAAPNRVVGVDSDRTMISHAHLSAQQEGLGNVVHVGADIGALPFRPEVFDACLCDRVLQHLRFPVTAVRELGRVTKKGGNVLLVDTDHASLTLSTRTNDVERVLCDFRVRRLRNGNSARELTWYAEQSDLDVVTIEVFPCLTRSYAGFCRGTGSEQIEREALEAGLVSQPELDAYHRDLRDREARSGFFSAVPMVVVACRKGGVNRVESPR